MTSSACAERVRGAATMMATRAAIMRRMRRGFTRALRYGKSRGPAVQRGRPAFEHDGPGKSRNGGLPVTVRTTPGPRLLAIREERCNDENQVANRVIRAGNG